MMNNTVAGQQQQQQCIEEIKAFVRGGIPGLARLSQVYPSILIHFNVSTPMGFCHVMHEAGVPSELWMSWPPTCTQKNHISAAMA